MIHAHGLFKRYGDLVALDRVSFDVERGSVVGFLGPNGAGKSTTMKILTGTLVPDGGTCEVAGRPVLPGDPESRRRVGYLPESTPLYRAMRVDRYLDFVAGVLGASRTERRREVARVIEACRIGQHAGRPIGALSKGYRQRVGLAQALLGDPDVLILDEPTSGLDPREVVRMRALVRELGQEKTILLSTHILSEIEATASRVIIIAGGRLVADGDPRAMAQGRAAELVVVLRLGIDDLDLESSVIGDELMGAAGVKEILGIEVEQGGVRRCVMRVERTPGCDTLHGEPVAELVTRRIHQRGWHLSELSWGGVDFEAAFLELTDEGANS
jgi:ABC-2 type transport system ATP-binding protein